jgi:hypothetical protein
MVIGVQAALSAGVLGNRPAEHTPKIVICRDGKWKRHHLRIEPKTLGSKHAWGTQTKPAADASASETSVHVIVLSH